MSEFVPPQDPTLGWASDVAAEMLRRTGLKYISLVPGASFRGLHDSIVNYLGNRDPEMRRWCSASRSRPPSASPTAMQK